MHNGVRGVIVLGRSGYGGFMAGIFWERQGHRMSGEGYSCFLGGARNKKWNVGSNSLDQLTHKKPKA